MYNIYVLMKGVHMQTIAKFDKVSKQQFIKDFKDLDYVIFFRYRYDIKTTIP